MAERNEPVKVLYIAGYQHSGTTLLTNLLGEQPGWFPAGEMRVYWTGFEDTTRRCGCGRPIPDCPFWIGVRVRMQREGPTWDPASAARLSRRARTRNTPWLWLPGGLNELASQLEPYLEAQGRLYRAVTDESASRILVDSSKATLYGRLLGRAPLVDLYVLHMVRDPRGVAHSMAKRARQHRWSLRYEPLGLLMLQEWSWTNRQVERWGSELGRRFMRLRYEDLVAAPGESLKQITEFVGEPAPRPDLVNDGVAQLSENHTVGGSQHRFDRGRVRVEGDFAWQAAAGWRRSLISLAGAGALRRYGYPSDLSWLNGALRRSGKVLGVLLNRGSSSTLRFLLNILIGRSLGPTGLGTYYLFDTWQRLLGFGGSLGLPQLVLRSVSVMEGRGQRQAAHRVLMRSLRWVALATGGLALLATLLAPLIAGRLLGKPELSWLLPLAGLGAIWLALIQLLARALNGRTRANLSLALENSALPAGLVLILAGGLLLGVPFTAQRLLRLYVGVGAAATGLGLLLWRLTGQPSRGEEMAQPVPGFERREMATFWLLGMVNVASNNLAYLILPQLVSTAEIGLFAASQRFVTMAVTIASALGALFATRFARHFAEGDQEALRHDLVLSQALSLLAYAPFVLAYLFLPGPLLAILGAEFQQASGILRILVFGQLVNAAGGLSSLGLQMSRDEGALLRLNLYFLVVNALAIGGLGWGFGLAGAAWGQSLALAARHLAIYLRARVTLRAGAAEARR